jgi:hypothetical protein
MSRIPEDPVTGTPVILDKETADQLLELATPETTRCVAHLMHLLETTGDREAQLELMRTSSRLLMLDVLYADLQTIVATCAHLIGDGFPALPEGTLRERFGNTLVFLGKLGGTDLREVIHRMAKLQEAERRAATAARFGVH